jgi:hypothetical protein
MYELLEKIEYSFFKDLIWCRTRHNDIRFFPTFLPFLSTNMEPYRFRECSPAMQAFKNKYWTTSDITVVLPLGFTGTKTEIAHCVLVLGCILTVKTNLPAGYMGHIGDRNDVLKDVYGDDKDKELALDAARAYHQYKGLGLMMLEWIEWVLLNTTYPHVLHKAPTESRARARLHALADLV